MTMVSTLPPVDVLYWGTTSKDLDLAHSMTKNLTARHRTVYLQREGKGLKVVAANGLVPTSGTYNSIDEAQKDILGPDGQSVVVKLNDCDILPDALQRLYREHVTSGLPSSEASFYPNFTDAVFKFQDQARESLSISDIAIVGPQIEDFTYYANERFEELYSEPKFIAMDLTRKCNKKCDKCMYHSPRTPYHIPKKESMPRELMLSILKQASEFDRKPNIHPFLSGEPFLYEHLEEYLKTLNKYGLGTSITTNGILLNEKNIQMLIDYEVSHLTISLDSINPRNYDKLQAPGHLDLVLSNIENLLEARERTNGLKVGLNFVLSHDNENEFDDYLDYWLGKVDTIVKAVMTNNFGDRAPEYPYFTEVKHTLPCLMPWVSMCIRPNGGISLPCSFDLLGNSSLNAHDLPLKEIWNAEEYLIWRKRFLDLEDERVSLFCKACKNCVAPSVTEQTEKYNVNYTPAMATFTVR